MTVIAVRGHVMAADSRITVGGTKYAGGIKIRRMQDGSLVGACGNWVASVSMLDFMELLDRKVIARDILKFGGACALHLRASGCYLLQGGQCGGISKLEGEFFADGSGSTAALAAMTMGATAKRAAEIACKIDNLCGEPIKVFRLR